MPTYARVAAKTAITKRKNIFFILKRCTIVLLLCISLKYVSSIWFADVLSSYLTSKYILVRTISDVGIVWLILVQPTYSYYNRFNYNML